MLAQPSALPNRESPTEEGRNRRFPELGSLGETQREIVLGGSRWRISGGFLAPSSVLQPTEVPLGVAGKS